MAQNIFEVVANNGAIIHANDELGFFITWNGVSFFQWWNAVEGGFEAVDVATCYGVADLAHAEKIAKEWEVEALAESE